MPVLPLDYPPPQLASLPPEGFRFYQLCDASGRMYAVGALGEHPDCLVLHLEVLRPRSAWHNFPGDLEWMKAAGRELGKRRIVGVKMSAGPDSADTRWRRFAERFGFVYQGNAQMAELSLVPAAQDRQEAPDPVLTGPTLSLCHHCYREIEARIVEQDGRLVMVKRCPEHGESESVVEPDAAFCMEAARNRGHLWRNFPGVNIEVTHRCNNRCPNCYHDREREEPGIDHVLARIAATPHRDVCLFGGEPTLRRDILDLIREARAMGKLISLYTNGLRLAEPGFCRALVNSGISGLGFSLHHPEYSTRRVFALKLQSLENLRGSGLVNHISFSLQHPGQIPGILDLIEAHREHSPEFRIRSAYLPERVDFFCSEMAAMVRAEAERRGKNFSLHPGAENTRYQVGFDYDGVKLWVMSWPSDVNIDLAQASGPPYASYVPGFCLHFCHMVAIQNGLKRGWLNGRRIAEV